MVEARGPRTFGYDPIFEYEGQTYAEMDKTAKVRPTSAEDHSATRRRRLTVVEPDITSVQGTRQTEIVARRWSIRATSFMK